MEDSAPDAAVAGVSIQPAQLCVWTDERVAARLLFRVVGRDDSRHDSVRLHWIAEWRPRARGRGQRQTDAGRMGAYGGRLRRDGRGGSIRNANRRAGAARKNLS